MCVFSNVTFINCNFHLANFDRCIFHSCTFIDCIFNRVKFLRNQIIWSTFVRSTYEYSMFYYSVLMHNRFTESNIINNSTNFTTSELIDNAFDEAMLQHHSEGQILTEDLIGYKKSVEGDIIQLRIPKGSVVFSINNKKCRTNHAIVEKFIDSTRELLHSWYNQYFSYKVGQEIIIDDFDMKYNVECGSGIHFFRTIEEAEAYHI